MSDIKRWRTEDDHYRPVEFVADDGPWVAYDDHNAAMQAKDATIEQLQARIAELDGMLYAKQVAIDNLNCMLAELEDKLP